MDLIDAARLSGLSRAQLAELLGVTTTTLDRYLLANRCPPAAARLLEVYAGRMPWRGCEHLRLIRGAIYHRENPDGLPVAEIPGYCLRLRQIAALERELTAYRRAPAQYLLDLPTP